MAQRGLSGEFRKAIRSLSEGWASVGVGQVLSGQSAWQESLEDRRSSSLSPSPCWTRMLEAPSPTPVSQRVAQSKPF